MEEEQCGTKSSISHWETPVFSRAPSRGRGAAGPMQSAGWERGGQQAGRLIAAWAPAILVLSGRAGCPAHGSKAGVPEQVLAPE